MKLKKTKILVYSVIITTLIYIVWRIFYTLPFGYGVQSLGFGLFLLLAEITGMFEQLVHFYMMKEIYRPDRPEVEDKDLPAVDVFIATYNEPVELLYKTVNGCVNMEYPDKKKSSNFFM